MAIWSKPITVEQLNAWGSRTLSEHLGIVVTEIGDDYLKATLPVDHRTKQPYGLLNGGASMALVETLASMAANCTVDPDQEYCVGLEINGNHVGSATAGVVTGTARSIHRGKTTQVWEVMIRQDERLICVSRITLMVMKKRT